MALSSWVNAVSSFRHVNEVIYALSNIIGKINSQFNSRLITTPGLAMAAGKKTATATKPIMAVVESKNVLVAPGDMPVISGTIAASLFAAWAFYVDSAGALSVSNKSADATSLLGALNGLESTPSGKLLLGVLVVQNGTASPFVGGTTNLDTDGVTATFIDAISNRASVNIDE